jgi:glyoxalase family protein
MNMITGLHHVTAMAGDAQGNLDFYAGVMGMRLVKRSVNQDDPGTYHLFYADGEGAPGSDLTFFPWGAAAPRGRLGAGVSTEVGLAVPTGSLEFWARRLMQYGVPVTPETRFGESTLVFTDPDGLEVALIEANRAGTPWEGSSVPAEHQVRGLHSARMWQRMMEPTTRFLTRSMGFTFQAEDNGWHRYVIGAGASGQILEIKHEPSAPTARFGAGVIHHLAWRVPDDATELVVRQVLDDADRSPTPVIDRFWFKSVYFREPGGAVFEIATDGPGFAVDEPAATLGETLVLPPWLEPQRAEIERVLPKLELPSARKRLTPFVAQG